MQVNLDDFFREQNELLSIDTGKQDIHWQKLQKTLVQEKTKKQTLKIAYLSILFLAIIGTGVFVWNKNKKTNIAEKEITANNPAISLPATATEPQPAPENIMPAPQKNSPEIVPAIKTTTLPKPAPLAIKATSATIHKEAKFYIDLTKEPEIFNINPNIENEITCKQGTIIQLPANSVTDTKDNIVRENISMIVQEYYRYDEEGISKDKVSAGMIKYELYKGTEKLQLKEGKVAVLKMKAVVGNSTIKMISSEDAIPENKLQQLRWVSADNFITDQREKIDYKITLDKKYDASTFMSEIAFPKQNVIMAGDIVNNSLIFHNVPVGETVYFISTGKIKDKYFSCSKKLVTGNTGITELDFVEISESLYKKQIDDLGKLGQ